MHWNQGNLLNYLVWKIIMYNLHSTNVRLLRKFSFDSSAYKVIMEKARGEVSLMEYFKMCYKLYHIIWGIWWSLVKRFWSYEDRKVGHSAQISIPVPYKFPTAGSLYNDFVRSPDIVDYKWAPRNGTLARGGKSFHLVAKHQCTL